MVLEFDYIKEEPIIPVVLENGRKRIFIEFFVDSGADMAMIPLSFAKLLGFDKWTYEELETAKGVEGGSIPYFVREVGLVLKEEKFKIKLACSVRDDIPFLLGRKSIFDRFIVCFNEKKKKIIFHSNESD